MLYLIAADEEFRKVPFTKLSETKGLFTRRDVYPSKWVKPAQGQKIARVYKQTFTGRITLQPWGT